MNKYVAVNLMDSIMEAKVINYFLAELEQIRREKPEEFIDCIVAFTRKASLEEFKFLYARINLTQEETESFLKVGWMMLTDDEKAKLITSIQEKLSCYAKNKEIDTPEFLDLEFNQREEIIENITFTTQEIERLAQIWIDGYIGKGNESIIESIRLKLSGWQTLGLLPSENKKSLDELAEPFLSVITNDTKIRNEEKESYALQILDIFLEKGVISRTKLKTLALNKNPVGRKKASLDKNTGEIKGNLKSDIRKILESYNAGKSIDNISSLVFPKTKTPPEKKEKIGYIRRILRSNKHLQIIPYDGK